MITFRLFQRYFFLFIFCISFHNQQQMSWLSDMLSYNRRQFLFGNHIILIKISLSLRFTNIVNKQLISLKQISVSWKHNNVICCFLCILYHSLLLFFLLFTTHIFCSLAFYLWNPRGYLFIFIGNKKEIPP